MARAAAQMKMGYYPTPEKTLNLLRRKIKLNPHAAIIDPCCGEGAAMRQMAYLPPDERESHYKCWVKFYGVELDTHRAQIGRSLCDPDAIVTGSIYDTVIRPAGCFSMLYLNPPYEYEKGERMEFLFLKKAHNWLKPGGVLIFLVPELVLRLPKVVTWIKRRYENIRVYRFHREEYPVFKQIALYAVKLPEEMHGQHQLGNSFGDTPYIEDTLGDYVYPVPPGLSPAVFEQKGMTPEEVEAFHAATVANTKKALGLDKAKEAASALSPLFPLRKGHIVSLLMSGVLNGRLTDRLVFKCFTKRHQTETTVVEDGKTKKVTLDSYVSGIRVIEKGEWYDVI